MQTEIPVPILFSPLKHHMHFLQEEIEKWKTMQWSEVHVQLLQIGNNLIDFYIGTLSVNEISSEILDFFRQRNLLERDAFLCWIQRVNWKKIPLSDGSEWLIKVGKDEKRFIHVHPAKHSKHSIRVRATTLKTVLALKIYRISPASQANSRLENVNRIRQKLMNLSPIKSLHSADSGILQLWMLFETTVRKDQP